MVLIVWMRNGNRLGRSSTCAVRSSLGTIRVRVRAAPHGGSRRVVLSRGCAAVSDFLPALGIGGHP